MPRSGEANAKDRKKRTRCSFSREKSSATGRRTAAALAVEEGVGIGEGIKRAVLEK